MKLYPTTIASTPHFTRQFASHSPLIGWAVCSAICFLGALNAAKAQTNQAAATLQISGTGTNVNVQWNNAGTLQSAPALGGPWTTYPVSASVSSSNTVPVNGAARFFRIVNNGVAGQLVSLLPTTLSSPLQVESATIQLLPTPVAAGNTRLVLTVQPGPNSPSSSNVITLLVNNSLTLLRDDGQFPDVAANDGNFSAVINVSPSDIDGWNAELANLPADAQMSYVFSGRSIIATNSMQPFPKTNFLGGQLVKLINNVITVGSGTNTATPCAGSPGAYNPLKTEMIIDLSVVADPTRTWDNHGPPMPHGAGGFGTQMGPWSFGLLISNIANTTVTGITPSDFVLRWLQSYQFPQTINGDIVPPVTNIQSTVIAPWQSATAAEGGFPSGAVDVAIAPFRLLAIVNRVDLRGNSTYGGTNSSEPAGEARFVFGVIPSGGPVNFTVILEYAVPLQDCGQVQAWGAQWAALNALALPSPAFNNALQAITDQFSRAGENPAQTPNMSAIAQVRANEFLGPQWELRQFNLDATGFLVESAVAATPAIVNNNTTNLTAFITNVPSPASFCIIGPLLATPSIPIPVLFNGNPFLGGWAPEAFGMFWNAPSIGGPQCCVRHIVSLNTCNSCHTQETGTAFTHVDPRAFGSQSGLSGFLFGTSVSDPSLCTSVTYLYSDLARRVQDLNGLVTCGCAAEVAHVPLQMTH